MFIDPKLANLDASMMRRSALIRLKKDIELTQKSARKSSKKKSEKKSKTTMSEEFNM